MGSKRKLDKHEKGLRTLQKRVDKILSDVPQTFTADLINLTVCARYLEALMRQSRVKHYLSKYHPPTFAKLEEVLAKFNSAYIILTPRKMHGQNMQIRDKRQKVLERHSWQLARQRDKNLAMHK